MLTRTAFVTTKNGRKKQCLLLEGKPKLSTIIIYGGLTFFNVYDIIHYNIYLNFGGIFTMDDSGPADCLKFVGGNE